MKYSKFLIFVLYFHIIVSWGCLYFTDNPYVDLNSLFLMTVISLSLILFLLVADEKNLPVLLIYVNVIFIYIHLRFLVIILDATAWKFIEYVPHFTVQKLNIALAFLLFGNLFCGLGFLLGSKVNFLKKKNYILEANNILLSFSPVLTGIILIFIIFIHLYLYWTVGIGRFSLMSGAGGIVGSNIFLRMLVFMLLVAEDVMLLIYFIVALTHLKFYGKFNIYLMFLVLILSIGFRMFSGSKSGLFVFLISFVISKFVVEGDFKINLKKFALAFVPLVILSVLTFYGGEASRAALYYGETKTESLSLDVVYKISEFEDDPWTGHKFRFVDELERITKRMNMLDPIILMVNPTEKNEENIRKYVHIEDMVKSTLDLLIPGQYFPDSFTVSRLWQVIYLKTPFWVIKEIYHTPIFSLWGIAFFHWGWASGLIMLFIFCFFITTAYNNCFIISTKYGILLQVWILSEWFWTLNSMSIEENIYLAYQDLGRGILLIIILVFINKKNIRIPLTEKLARNLNN